MVPDMYHHDEIAEGLLDVCCGRMAVKADVEGGKVLRVGSNRLFGVGDAVAVGDTRCLVVELRGLMDVVLDQPVRAEHGDYLQLMSYSQVLAICKSAVGSVATFGPEAWSLVVEPCGMRQDLREGGKRAFLQEYTMRVYFWGGEGREGTEFAREIG